MPTTPWSFGTDVSSTPAIRSEFWVGFRTRMRRVHDAASPRTSLGST